MRTLMMAWAAAAIVSSAGSAQSGLDSEPWTGDVSVEYSPTQYLGHVRAQTLFNEAGWLAVACSSDERDFTPCVVDLFGAFTPPPRIARHVVLSIFKDGDRVAIQTFERRSVSVVGGDRVALHWQMNAGSAGALWLALGEGGRFTFQFADANGLGRPVTYATHIYTLPPLPQRAIDIVHTMRTSDARPRIWAEDILGNCSRLLDGQEGYVQVELRGEAFENRRCVE